MRTTSRFFSQWSRLVVGVLPASAQQRTPAVSEALAGERREDPRAAPARAAMAKARFRSSSFAARR